MMRKQTVGLSKNMRPYSEIQCLKNSNNNIIQDQDNNPMTERIQQENKEAEKQPLKKNKRLMKLITNNNYTNQDINNK